jgi:hypothetical protein
MKNRKATDWPEKPVVETDSYRIWPGKHISAEKQKKMEKLTLSASEGERVHNIVVMELVEGDILKVLSKVRDTDQKINVLIKFETPTDRCTVIRVGKWISENGYSQLLDALKRGLGAINITTTSGEEVHAGIAYSFRKNDAPPRTGISKKKKGDRDVA